MAVGTNGRAFRVKVQRQSDGQFLAICEGPACMARGPSEEDALRKIRDEIRYRIEWCPCSGVADDYVQLDIERR